MESGLAEALEGCSGEQPIVWPTRTGQDRGMFLRRNRRQHRGELYEYWTLVECARTARGPRQRVVATLGKLPSLDQAVARQVAIKPAEDLKLPVVTEADLEAAIRAETNWKVKWALQRSLATLQTARAVENARAIKPIGVRATVSRSSK